MLLARTNVPIESRASSMLLVKTPLRMEPFVWRNRSIPFRHLLAVPFPPAAAITARSPWAASATLPAAIFVLGVVVETGVAYGVTSTYILSALEENGHGQLYSIDLPPLADDAEKYIGYFIRPELRGRWHLQIGPAQKLLRDLLLQTTTIDMFVHDSLHTYSHMKWEFEAALASLRPGGVLISDDIEGNRAFEEITRHPSISSWMAIRQQGKHAICGALRTRS